ncbi:hypothetical protein [Apibacter sp. HY039]|uniref:hypothetical protein n=1 Tax=Apibacter sp. HY039 TaxID=2501476 RepID=UPI000FEBFC10|nr:hypothetical protein [Apibacter sp. HY039]
MKYQKIKVNFGDTISQIAADYGYKSSDGGKIWNDIKNSSLRNRRKKITNLSSDDELYIPIPWKIIYKDLTKTSSLWYKMEAKRNGDKGKYLRWTQTVFQDNQPIGSTNTFCVDACPPDDDEPFYYTLAELNHNSDFRLHFYDIPKRPNPINRPTAWRAVLSISSIFEKKVSIIDSIVWGIDFHINGKLTKYNPRKATLEEINGHIKLLSAGNGLTQTFKDGGWTFQKAIEY